MSPGVYLDRVAIIHESGVETVIQMMLVHDPDSTPTVHNLSPDMAMQVATQLMFLAAEIDPHLVDEAS